MLLNRFWILTFTVLLGIVQGLAQEGNKRTLKGTIFEDGKPMIGATIQLASDLNNGTISNMEGKFQINVEEGKDFLLRIGMCICGKRPRDIRIRKIEEEVVLKLKGCDFSKKAVKKLKKKEFHNKLPNKP